jgi:hypothetical protein
MHLARVLTADGRIGMDDLRVVDPHRRPLTLWKRLTRRCGMPYLRSPHTHNIDIPIMSLRRYWSSRADSFPGAFIDPYLRPGLDLFNRHCDQIIAEQGLEKLWIRGRAAGVRRIPSGLRVMIEDQYLDTREMVLAMGRNEHPFWPAWAQQLRESGGRLCHIYDAGARPENLSKDGAIVIVGGGISAASLALRLVNGGHAQVTLLSRQPIRTDNLDFDPGWAGPKRMRPFEKVPYDRRRAIVDGERRRGTVTQEVAAALRNGAQGGRLRIVDDGPFSAVIAGESIRFQTAQGIIDADQVVLATGFEKGIPGGRFVQQTISDFSLPVAPCGYPRLSPSLQWHDGIYVMGPLAELAIGPAAGNIIGGRHGARRILAALGG